MRKRLVTGLAHLQRNPKGVRQDVTGERIGDITVVRSVAYPYSELRCERGHTTYKTTTYLRQSKRDGVHVRCSECVRIGREVRV